MSPSEVFLLVDKALPGKTFTDFAPAEAREPYVILERYPDDRYMTLCGPTNATLLTFRIHSYAKTTQDAGEIMDRIYALVDACEGDPLIDKRQDWKEQDTRIKRVTAVLTTTYHTDEVQ
ncbi:hypothetical protein QF001_003767 [Paraburkholderia youngii]|uniref:tail completion protein gp17 n=1 Tax=Paraburkholderia youngii TaxID=2782701 RepID=UPI003D2314E4